MDRFVVISGCSGGGKSSLIDELSRRGCNTIEEPGRRIVNQEAKGAGAALPWVDMAAFARRAVEMTLQDRDKASGLKGWAFFDRCLVDAAAALEHVTGEPTLGGKHRYHRRVFMAPPWPEIYASDSDRRHSFDVARSEYERLVPAYASLGYEVIILPKVGISERADFILRALADGESWRNT